MSINMKRLWSLAILSLWISLTGMAVQSEELDFSSPKSAFDAFSIVLADEDITWPNTEWRIVHATDDMTAFSSEEVILAGITDDNGKSTLNVRQKEKLFSAWQKAPANIWLVFNLESFRLALKNTSQGRYALHLIWRGYASQAVQLTQQPIPENLKTIPFSFVTVHPAGVM